MYGAAEAQNILCVYIEDGRDQVARVSLELMTKGRQLAAGAGWRLVGLLIGARVQDQIGLAFEHGADEVWVVEHPLLEDFSVDGYTHAACAALREGRPSAFLLGATHDGRDLAGRLAVRLRTGLNADCTDLHLDPDRGLLVSDVTGFGGGVIARLECPHARPQMSTVRPGVFPVDEPQPGRMGEIVRVDVDLDPGQIRTQVAEQVIGEGVDLTQAPVLVCGGRGMEGDFDVLERLAGMLGGDVGGTRPPVDEGHIPRARQVGQTGVVCRPKVALACGISGAFHFVVGIQEAGLIASINTDPEAPIFEYSDYFAVGDTNQILPELVKALEREGEGARV